MAIGEESTNAQGDNPSGLANPSPAYGLPNMTGAPSAAMAAGASGSQAAGQNVQQLLAGPYEGVGKSFDTLPYAGTRFDKWFSQWDTDGSFLSGSLNLNFSPPAGYVAIIRGISLFSTCVFPNLGPGSPVANYIEWFSSLGNNYLERAVPLLNGTPIKSVPELPTFTKTVPVFIPMLDTDVFDIFLQASGFFGANDTIRAYVRLQGEYLLSRGLSAQLEVSL